ncbi:MAG: SagB/ThcOx family dehydrogenase [Candidatus Pacebacteria bacterium]|jgi:SagB-type dehydrogenase family enzyme|nr:SagB/ThcOx family dehydrogenase [Candidatus Paceibacterota bacterium]
MKFKSGEIKLPNPKLKSKISLEEAITKRKSLRAYTKSPLSLKEVSQLLFAGQGLLGGDRRTIPSAGAFYPIEIYLSAARITDLPQGLYQHLPDGHKLKKITSANRTAKLAAAAFGQIWVKNAPAVLIICGDFEKTVKKYQDKGEDFVTMEAGHAAQNISLQAAALNLGTLCVGGFNEKEAKSALNIEKNKKVFYLMPVGKTFKNQDEKEAEVLNDFYQILEKEFLKDL